MPKPYDHEALWVKAKLFLNHAMDDDEPRTFDEKALWASLALELLAKSALARISPLLIAEPTEEGINLLVASGLVEGEARFSSVRAQTIYTRCSKAFKPFSKSEALSITAARNEYLHGAGVGFNVIPPEAWWPRFWAQAVILVNAMDTDIDSLVGASRIDLVGGHLAQNARNLEHRVEMLIARARQRLAQHESGSLNVRAASELNRFSDLTAGLKHHAEASCPACGALGTVEGEDVVESEIKYEQMSEEDFNTWAELTVGADYFSCPRCKLVLDSYEVLEAAEVDTTFETTDDDASDYHEAEYGND